MSAQSMQDAQLNRLLGGVKIPPQPQLLLEIQEEKDQAEPDLNRIGQLIGRDPGLTAAVLKCVNSAAFALDEKISSPVHAVSFLGLDATINITTALLMQQTFGKEDELHEFWESATNTARLGSYLANHFGNARADEMYLLGLFHDCAIPLMISQLPGYGQKRESCKGRECLAAMEDRIYQTSHAVIAYLMAREWGLSDDVRDTILDHHRVELVMDDRRQNPKSYHTLLANLKLAEHVDHLANGSEDPEWAHIHSMVQITLGLSDIDMADLIADMREFLIESDAP